MTTALPGVEVSIDSKIHVWLPSRIGHDAEKAWDDFLVEFAPLILQVVHLFERDPDRTDDCFVFCCEHLKRNNLKRLRRFDPSGSASFPTWLRAVIRNLCLDWRRQRFGRPRPYRSITRLPQLDQDIYRCIYLRGLSENETFNTVRAFYPTLTRLQLAESLGRVEAALSSRQSWLLTSSQPQLESLSTPTRDSESPNKERVVAARNRDPEEEASRREQLTALRSALRKLSTQQRLLVRLRFEQGLTFEQIARLMQLSSPLQAQRALQQALATLREAMGEQTASTVSVKDS